MGFYTYPRKRKVGSSVSKNKTEVKYIDKEFSAIIPGTYNVGEIVSNPSVHYFNRWFSMTPASAGNPPDHPGSFFSYYNSYYNYANSGAAFEAYNSSAFSLTIPQGTNAHSRIGNVVQVLKDKWYIRIRPNLVATTYASPYYTSEVSRYLSERPFRVRALCIFQDSIDIPGRQWLTSHDVFEFPNKLESRLDPGGGKGFTVVYDKVHSFNGVRPTATATEAPSDNGVEVQNSSPTYCQFGMTAHYVRQYADRDEDADDRAVTLAGVEADPVTPTGNATSFYDHRGVSRGQLQWFFFFEDEYATVFTGSSTEGDVADRKFYPSLGMEMFVLRKTSYADD